MIVVVAVNLLASLVVLPRLDLSFLSGERWGGAGGASVTGVWSVLLALAIAIVTLVAINYRRLSALRETVDAGATASVLPVI